MQTIPPSPFEGRPAAAKDPRVREKGSAHFWRACRFLYPYRGMVLISILSAIFVSAANTAGLSTMLPIMRVLVKGDTIATWADREITQRRIGLRFSDETKDLVIVKIDPAGRAAAAGLHEGDVLFAPPQNTHDDVARLLDSLANPAAVSQIVDKKTGGACFLTLPPLSPWMALSRRVAQRVPRHPVGAVAVTFCVIAILAILSNIAKFWQEYLSDKAAVLTVNDIRRRLYDRVLHIPLSHFNLRGTSDVTSRLTQDAQGLSEGFKTVLGQSIQEPIKAAMAFTLAILISWKLTLFIVIFAPLMLTIIRKFGKKMRRASKKAMVSSASMLGQIEGSLIGIRVVKGANAERFERRRYTRIMDRLIGEQLRMSRIDSISEPVIELLTLFVVGAVLMFASWMVLIRHSLEVTSFFLVMGCLASIGDSLRRVSKVSNVLAKSNAAAARIFEVMDLPIEKKGWHAGSNGHRTGETAPSASRSQRDQAESAEIDSAADDTPVTKFGVNGAAATLEYAARASADAAKTSGWSDRQHLDRPRIKLASLQREVRFENLTFTYPGATSPAISDVTLSVPRGKCIAVVGRNGSGKTTLLALLPRFYDPERGRILIDGVDIRDCTLSSLRQQISLVTQDSVIFPGTVAENIAYGHPLVTASPDSEHGLELRKRIEDSARRAFAHDFIVEKPQGYDTLLGGLGAQLSGGQKQRICIARAIFRQSPILVLDEATSQVDAESEALIQKAINAILHERTTFVIAHRFSTILSADEIVVMDRGQIVGQGSHDELLATCQTYLNLYERQLIVPGAA